jgi:hypothetical protein
VALGLGGAVAARPDIEARRWHLEAAGNRRGDVTVREARRLAVRSKRRRVELDGGPAAKMAAAWCFRQCCSDRHSGGFDTAVQTGVVGSGPTLQN